MAPTQSKIAREPKQESSGDAAIWNAIRELKESVGHDNRVTVFRVNGLEQRTANNERVIAEISADRQKAPNEQPPETAKKDRPRKPRKGAAQSTRENVDDDDDGTVTPRAPYKSNTRQPKNGDVHRTVASRCGYEETSSAEDANVPNKSRKPAPRNLPPTPHGRNLRGYGQAMHESNPEASTQSQVEQAAVSDSDFTYFCSVVISEGGRCFQYSCAICGANATNDSKAFLAGLAGIQGHINSKHLKHWPNDVSKPPKLIRFMNKRELSRRDADLIAAGKPPKDEEIEMRARGPADYTLVNAYLRDKHSDVQLGVFDDGATTIIASTTVGHRTPTKSEPASKDGENIVAELPTS